MSEDGRRPLVLEPASTPWAKAEVLPIAYDFLMWDGAHSDARQLELTPAVQTFALLGFDAGQRLSIRAIIRSAVVIASEIAVSLAGDGLPSHCASFRAARMLAAISRTRLRPSSICSVYHLRFPFAIEIFGSFGSNQEAAGRGYARTCRSD
jgi:hypothetical protein